MRDGGPSAVSSPVMKLAPPGKGRITRACWGPMNHTIISCGEDGNLYKWDTETGKVLETVEAHDKMVQVGAEDGSGSTLHPRHLSPHPLVVLCVPHTRHLWEGWRSG